MSSFALASDLCVRVRGSAAERLVGAWLAGLPTRDDGTPAAVEVRDAARAIDVPSGPRDAFFGEIDAWADDGAHVLVAPTGRACVRRDVIDASGGKRAPAWLGLLALALALRHHEVFHLHAGGVALDDGPVLVVGGSGAGKTTTTLALLAHVAGARSLGDDTLFLRTSGAVVPSARPYHLTDATLAMFPALADRVSGVVHEATRKHVVAVAPAVDRAWPAPQALLFPTVTTTTRSSAERLSPAETLARLIGQSAVLALPGVAARVEHLALLGRLADRAPGFALHLGTDAAHDSACAARAAMAAIAA